MTNPKARRSDILLVILCAVSVAALYFWLGWRAAGSL